MTANVDSPPKQCGVVAILGAPNAGKSTLVNALVGTKISIVTPKVQTTRFRVRGICQQDNTQLVLVDTPGIFAAHKPFEKTLVKEAWAGVGDADMIVLMVDVLKPIDEDVLHICHRLKHIATVPAVLVLNKIDKLKHKQTLLAIAQQLNEAGNFQDTFMISALKAGGIEAIQYWMVRHAPQGPWLFPADQPTDLSMRALAAEITREKLFLRMRQELPYSLTVETENWQEEENLIRVHQAIVVERDAHKKIIIGKQGEMLKTIGTSARHDIERMCGCKVMLELFVKVEPKWKTTFRPEML